MKRSEWKLEKSSLMVDFLHQLKQFLWFLLFHNRCTPERGRVFKRRYRTPLHWCPYPARPCRKRIIHKTRFLLLVVERRGRWRLTGKQRSKQAARTSQSNGCDQGSRSQAGNKKYAFIIYWLLGCLLDTKIKRSLSVSIINIILLVRIMIMIFIIIIIIIIVRMSSSSSFLYHYHRSNQHHRYDHYYGASSEQVS